MKQLKITRVGPKDKEFQNKGQLFTVCRNRNKTVWTLYTRFRGEATYRILEDVERNVPVGIQRLKTPA
jgi:hypothetical protein